MSMHSIYLSSFSCLSFFVSPRLLIADVKADQSLLIFRIFCGQCSCWVMLVLRVVRWMEKKDRLWAIEVGV